MRGGLLGGRVVRLKLVRPFGAAATGTEFKLSLKRPRASEAKEEETSVVCTLSSARAKVQEKTTFP